jgi:Na+-driven multidrug efflux pump
MIAYGIVAALSLGMAFFSKQLVCLYGLSPESSELARKLFVLHCISVSTVHPTAFCLTNSFRAASDVRFTMVISMISMWVFRVGLSYVFGKFMGLGVMGVWYAMICDWAFRAIIFGTRFVRGTWLTKYKALEKKQIENT